MERPLTIKQANALNPGEIFVALSDGRVLMVTLAQVLSLNPEVHPVRVSESD